MNTRTLLALFMLAVAVRPTTAQVVLRDDFDTDSSALYRVLEFNPERDGANFAFDYGTHGIPSAPSSEGGSAIGVQLWANNPAVGTTNAPSAIQLIPQGIGSTLVGQSYRMSFDVWMNVNGPLPGGGGGSTEAFMAGAGWNGRQPIEVGTENGTYFTVTGEGGSSTDVRIFDSAGFNAAGTIVGPSPNTGDAYYTEIFPGGVDVIALPVQGGQDAQTGTTVPGQMAFQWHRVDLEVMDGTANFYVDDLLIGTSSGSDLEGNLMVGYGDYFGSETDAPQWSFGIIDNLEVNVVPEPSALALALLGVIGLLRFRR